MKLYLSTGYCLSLYILGGLLHFRGFGWHPGADDSSLPLYWAPEPYYSLHTEYLPQAFCGHLCLNVPKTEFGSFCPWNQIHFFPGSSPLNCRMWKPVYHPWNTSLPSPMSNQSSTSDAFTSCFTSVFISIYLHCHSPNLGHHHFSIELPYR